jgi:hypothetical protein
MAKYNGRVRKIIEENWNLLRKQGKKFFQGDVYAISKLESSYNNLTIHLKLSNYETIASLPGFGMAPVAHLSYSTGPNMRAGRTQPCSVRGRIDPIPPKG